MLMCRARLVRQKDKCQGDRAWCAGVVTLRAYLYRSRIPGPHTGGMSREANLCLKRTLLAYCEVHLVMGPLYQRPVPWFVHMHPSEPSRMWHGCCPHEEYTPPARDSCPINFPRRSRASCNLQPLTRLRGKSRIRI